jgi:hypothetical protein
VWSCQDRVLRGSEGSERASGLSAEVAGWFPKETEGDRWDTGLGLQGWRGRDFGFSYSEGELRHVRVRCPEFQGGWRTCKSGGESKLIFELRLQNRNIHELSIATRISPIDGGKTEQRADSPNGETQGIISSAISLLRYHAGRKKGRDYAQRGK